MSGSEESRIRRHTVDRVPEYGEKRATLPMPHTAIVFFVVVTIVVTSLGAYSFTTTSFTASRHYTGNTFMSVTTDTTSEYAVSTNQGSTSGQWVLSYLTSAAGCATGPSDMGPWTPTGCGGNRADAVVFNCVAQAESPQGCTQYVPIRNSTAGFWETVWFNYSGNHVLANGQIGNCTWSNTTQMITPPPAVLCLLLNSTAFLLAEPHSVSPP